MKIEFMKYGTLFLILNMMGLHAICQDRSGKRAYKIPDSISATACYAEIKMAANNSNKRNAGGISVCKTREICGVW
jgi:hypothetical protein